MYYTRTKNNRTDEVSVEVYGDYKSLVDDRRFFNRSDGLYRVREIKWRDLKSVLNSKRARKPDVIRIMTKDGIHFPDLPDWLHDHIRCHYRPRTWGDEKPDYEGSADFYLVA